MAVLRKKNYFQAKFLLILTELEISKNYDEKKRFHVIYMEIMELENFLFLRMTLRNFASPYRHFKTFFFPTTILLFL